MSKKIITINILLMLGIIIGDVFYILFGGLWLKGLTSLLFALLGLINFIYTRKQGLGFSRFGLLITLALFICFVADIVLNLNFILGAIIFAIGHLSYIFAYSNLQKFVWKDLITSVIIFVPAFLLIILCKAFDFGGKLMEMVCIIYALIISIMVGKCISNLIKNRCLLNILLVVGSALFMFSDIMLLFSQFANVSAIMGILCLATYYPGQAILSHSLLFVKNKNRTTE